MRRMRRRSLGRVYYVHKNVNMYFTDTFGRGAVIKPRHIGENSMHVQAPIHSRAATCERQ